MSNTINSFSSIISVGCSDKLAAYVYRKRFESLKTKDQTQEQQ